jgi:hypothetical protein
VYLRERQGNGLQLNVTFNSGTVPGPQGLLGTVSLQESRGTHRLQDVVVTATVRAPGHGFLHVREHLC